MYRSQRKCCVDHQLGQHPSHPGSTPPVDEEGLEKKLLVLFGALNMYHREIFAYPHFIQRKLAASAPGK